MAKICRLCLIVLQVSMYARSFAVHTCTHHQKLFLFIITHDYDNDDDCT